MASIAIVGVGYWGKNLIRIFSDISDVSVCVHQGSKENREWLKTNYPSIRVTTDYETVLTNPEIDAIVIATPIETHYELTSKALRHEKDVFVEKPLAETAKQAERLTHLANRKDSILFVGYIFLCHPTLQPIFTKAKEDTVTWGQFSWNKLGDFNVDILLDTVSHPVAIALRLFGEMPDSVDYNEMIRVTSSADTVSSTLHFSEGRTFDIKVDRISPDIGKSMHVVFNNNELYYWNEEGLNVFDIETMGFDKIKVAKEEPLRKECQKFHALIEGEDITAFDNRFGLRVNRVLENIMLSE